MATEASTNAFTRAVHVVFGEWTALKLAVENEWGGHNSRDKGLGLLQRVLSGMLSTATVHRDELQDLLDLALLDDFNIEAEDDSPYQVAQLLCQLHAEAKSGQTQTAEQLLQRAATRGSASWIEVPPPPKVKGEDDSSSDDGDDGEDGDEAGGGGGGAGSSSRRGGGGDADMMEADEPPAPKEPEVDEDGFQMVSSRRGGRRR